MAHSRNDGFGDELFKILTVHSVAFEDRDVEALQTKAVLRRQLVERIANDKYAHAAKIIDAGQTRQSDPASGQLRGNDKHLYAMLSQVYMLVQIGCATGQRVAYLIVWCACIHAQNRARRTGEKVGDILVVGHAERVHANGGLAKENQRVFIIAVYRVVILQNLADMLARAAQEYRPDLGAQLLWGEWLGNIGIGPRLQRAQNVLFGRTRRKHNDGEFVKSRRGANLLD